MAAPDGLVSCSARTALAGSAACSVDPQCNFFLSVVCAVLGRVSDGVGPALNLTTEMPRSCRFRDDSGCKSGHCHRRATLRDSPPTVDGSATFLELGAHAR